MQVRTGILDRYPFRSARKIRDSEVQVENARRRRAENFGDLKGGINKILNFCQQKLIPPREMLIPLLIPTFR